MKSKHSVTSVKFPLPGGNAFTQDGRIVTGVNPEQGEAIVLDDGTGRGFPTRITTRGADFVEPRRRKVFAMQQDGRRVFSVPRGGHTITRFLGSADDALFAYSGKRTDITELNFLGQGGVNDESLDLEDIFIGADEAFFCAVYSYIRFDEFFLSYEVTIGDTSYHAAEHWEYFDTGIQGYQVSGAPWPELGFIRDDDLILAQLQTITGGQWEDAVQHGPDGWFRVWNSTGTDHTGYWHIFRHKGTD